MTLLSTADIGIDDIAIYCYVSIDDIAVFTVDILVLMT